MLKGKVTVLCMAGDIPDAADRAIAERMLSRFEASVIPAACVMAVSEWGREGMRSWGRHAGRQSGRQGGRQVDQ